ncbi:MAG TPA: carboxylating nicotinate-nucleotide diphosphorylase [Inquilinus sp.]|nr:carboxylating nicotinate-nucleotide diphosphorylase [Inquilinus sp.]
MYDRYATTRLIDLWLQEDIGYCDLTVQVMIEPEETGAFVMNAREPMVVSGIEVAAEVFRRYDPRCAVTVRVKDGDRVTAGQVLLDVSGPAQAILTAERTALNITQRLSGIATETARYVAEIAGTGARLLDTRKTTPGLRMLEKHATACGGALNHRLGLDNGVMIKDNHIAVCGSIAAAVRRARRTLPMLTKIEVECDSLEQVDEAVLAGADVIMLDNMPVPTMRRAVETVAGRIPLEASGGVRFETIRAIAQTGVDYISTSKITQSAPAMDIGLDEANRAAA